MRAGNLDFIRQTFAMLNTSSRELDGMIALAVLSYPAFGNSFVMGNAEVPFALRTKALRTTILDDVIEFPYFDGTDYVLASAAKVPCFTTNICDALRLISGTKWSMSSDGLAECEHAGKTFRAALQTPELSLCAIGLQFHEHLHESDLIA